ncbi:MAG: hypothetical protein ABGY42_05090 [bacterium]
MSEARAISRGTSPTLGRPEAAALIWQWQAKAEAAESPSWRRARIRGAFQASAGAIAGSIMLWFGLTLMARGVFTLATILLLSSLLSPGGAYAFLERLFAAIAGRMGDGLMWLLMVPTYYLFFMPFGQLFRRGRNDRLKRFLQPDADTYWEPHEGPTSASTSRLDQY